MRIVVSALPLLLVFTACGSDDLDGLQTGTHGFTIEVDDADYGAVKYSASLSKVDEGWRLVLGGMKPEDPNRVHDEFGMYLWIVLSDLDQRVDGETIVIDGVSSFEVELEPLRARPIDVTTVAGPTQDPGIVAASLRQGCHCFPAEWQDQTVSGTLTLNEVSTERIDGTIELETSGGLPYYDWMSATPAEHTSSFAGSFRTK